MTETFAGLYIAFWVFLVVVGILWIIMPFAIFGTKGVLRELLAEQRETNRLLSEALKQSRAAIAAGTTGSPAKPPERFRDF